MSTKAATNSLERGLALMRAIGQKRGGMTNAELSRELSIPKSTCTYILTRLEREGYVVRNKTTGRYKVGLKTLALAHDALREVGFHAMAEPALYRLAEATGLVAIVGALEGNRVLTVDRVESPEFMHDSAEKGRSRWPYYPSREQRGIGSEHSLYATSLGRVLLAYLPRKDLLEILQSVKLTKLTPKTIVSKTELLAELERIREQGYAITDQQTHMDTLAIAAPIFDANGVVRASVCIGGSRVLPAFHDLDRLIAQVTEAGREISKRMTQVVLMADRQPVLAEVPKSAPVKSAEPSKRAV